MQKDDSAILQTCVCKHAILNDTNATAVHVGALLNHRPNVLCLGCKCKGESHRHPADAHARTHTHTLEGDRDACAALEEKGNKNAAAQKGCSGKVTLAACRTIKSECACTGAQPNHTREGCQTCKCTYAVEDCS
eukprot:1157379-Pelagomonas_calceolata.AAC.2